MIEIQIPKEIKDYKTKYLLNLTLRQNISIVLLLGINVPLYIKGIKLGISKSVLEWLMIIIGLPIVAIGFFKYNEMTIEKFLLTFIQTEFIYPKIRPYKMNTNFYRNIKSKIIKNERAIKKERKKAKGNRKFFKRGEK